MTKLDLESILKETQNNNFIVKDRIVLVDVDLLKPNANNLYNIDNVDDILHSLKSVGQLEPIECDSEYQIISGHRRHKALKLYNENTRFPLQAQVVIKDYTSEEEMQLALVLHNAQRVKTAEEKRKEINKLSDVLKSLKNKEPKKYRNLNIINQISDELGVSRSTVKRALKFDDNTVVKKSKKNKTQLFEFNNKVFSEFVIKNRELRREYIFYIIEQCDVWAQKLLKVKILKEFYIDREVVDETKLGKAEIQFIKKFWEEYELL